MRQYQKILAANDIYSYRRYLQKILVLTGILLFSFYNNTAYANPFAIPDDFSVASCPLGHKKYAIGNNASTATTQPLSLWKAGETSRTFTFEENSGNKTFTIGFPILIDSNNSYGGTVPFYGSIDGVSSNAINLVHNSTKIQKDNSLDISINRPVSKIGYKVQDLDSTTVSVNVGSWWLPRYENRAPYIEEVNVSKDNGRLTFNNAFHQINSERNIVTAKEGENCGTNECTIDATWGYKPAGSTVNLNHNNTKREANGSHAVGYSDFYFCLAPPKLIVKKQLSGNRVNNSANNTDQFEISINRGTSTLGSYTTTGSNATVTNASSEAISLAENTSYTITEKVRNGTNGTTLGEIANYTASYSCTNATTGSTTVMPTAAMSYNEANKTRSFTLADATYGDEITCTIINTPIDNYTFTGFVFNDNGGIARNTNPDTKSDVSTTFTGNSKYFNGVFDSGEKGIGTTTNLSVSLTNCNGVNLGNTTSQNTSNNPLGQYKFTVPASVIAALNPQKVCIVQAEPDSWIYSVDTTPNNRSVDLQNGKFDYKTEGAVNLDFGEVEADYAALVLRKAQFVNNCPSTLDYSASTLNTAGNTNPRTGFSESGISGSDLVPGQCIAYRIQAYNRGHINLQSIQIKDELQVTPVKSVFHLPFPVGLPNNINNNSNRLPNSEIMSNQFNLEAAPLSGNAPKATLYFNTKYGTTVDP
ncbi:hypothetical protein ACTXLD_08625 [Psychrobacter faecalis]